MITVHKWLASRQIVVVWYVAREGERERESLICSLVVAEVSDISA